MQFQVSDTEKEKPGIYGIFAPCGRVYVGQTMCFAGRYKEHLTMLKKVSHHNGDLQDYVNKNGLECLVFRVIEIVEDGSLTNREQYHIAQKTNVFNGSKLRSFAEFKQISVKESTKRKARFFLNREIEKTSKELNYDDLLNEALDCLAEKKPYLKKEL